MSVFDLLSAELDAAVLTPGAEVSERYFNDWHVKAAADIRPLALARPRTTLEVSAILRICNATRTPVVPQGGMTGLAGGGIPVEGAVVLSLERMRAIEELDRVASTITVEAGVALQAVQEAADAAGLLFPLDIGSRGSCLIGGNVSTNAGGNRVLRYGMARDLVLGVEAVLADGTVINSLNKMLKNNSGYDLKQLFIGSEGTLGVVTRAVLRLFPKPTSTCTALCAVEDFDHVYRLLERARSGLASELSAFEVMWPGFYDRAIGFYGKRPPLPGGYAAHVLVEMMGTDPDGDATRFERVIAGALEAGECADAVIAQSVGEANTLWAIRDMSGEITRALQPLGNFDVCVEIGKIGAFVEDCMTRCRQQWPGAEVVVFGHIADSNIHVLVNAGQTPFPERQIEECVYGCVRDWGGSISAEHGIGVIKKPFLSWTRTEAELTLMRTLKAAMDPVGILNPGKVFDPA